MVAGSIPPALSWMMIVPESTMTVMSGATSASSQASSALSTASLPTTSGQS
jgi:hypothetical protein